jgi:hypothetical protein
LFLLNGTRPGANPTIASHNAVKTWLNGSLSRDSSPCDSSPCNNLPFFQLSRDMSPCKNLPFFNLLRSKLSRGKVAVIFKLLWHLNLPRFQWINQHAGKQVMMIFFTAKPAAFGYFRPWS